VLVEVKNQGLTLSLVVAVLVDFVQQLQQLAAVDHLKPR
jgi:hypothetical protein